MTIYLSERVKRERDKVVGREEGKKGGRRVERKEVGQGEEEEQRVSGLPFVSSFPKIPAIARAGPSGIQEPRSPLDFPHGWQALKYWAIIHSIPRSISRKLQQKCSSWHYNQHANMGCRYPKPRFNLISHNTHHVDLFFVFPILLHWHGVIECSRTKQKI